VQASNSGGLALKNSGGTTQMLLGGGGGDNITLSVATNITPANAAVAISPTGTGTLTLNPATASTINNMSIGATTALSGRFTDVTATTGNFVVGTSGQGVDFSATPGTGTSELLADYEEGTFTPTYNGSTPGATTHTLQSGIYTKVGNVLYYNIRLAWSNTTGTGNGVVSGFPFTAQNAYHTTSILPSDYAITALNIMSARIGFGASLDLFQTPVGGGTQSAAPVDTAAELTITGFYFV
jgi:hypothetical protein